MFFVFGINNQFKELNIGEQLSQYKEQIEDKNINI